MVHFGDMTVLMPPLVMIIILVIVMFMPVLLRLILFRR
jgi:hypothetical protein